MAEPFLAEIRIMSFGFPPKGWALCNGQLLPINQNQALFALLGTTYGGDGRVNFGLPNLQSHVPISFGAGHSLGERAGEAAHTITLQEMPTHTHQQLGSPSNGNVPAAVGNVLAAALNVYAPANNPTTLGSTSVSNVGGSQPHENRQPFLALNFSIALQGIFPSQT